MRRCSDIYRVARTLFLKCSILFSTCLFGAHRSLIQAASIFYFGSELVEKT